MKIAVVGTQCIGKSTFIKDFLNKWSMYKTPDESYRKENPEEDYIEAELTEEEIEEYRKGGFIIDEYPDGGQIYTYAGNPNASYKKIGNQWYISNKSTGNNFIPINDPEGKRAAELNKNAVALFPGQPKPVEEIRPVQGAPKPVINQTVWENAAGTSQKNAIAREKQLQGLKNSVVLADQELAKKIESQKAASIAAYENQMTQNMQHEQPLDMMDWLWQVAAFGPTVAPGAWTAAETVGSAALPYLQTAFNTSLPGMSGIAGATYGNALASGFAGDAIVNRLLPAPGKIQEGKYGEAAADVATGVLDLWGANMLSPLYQGTKTTASELGRFIGTKEGLLSNAYKVNPFANKIPFLNLPKEGELIKHPFIPNQYNKIENLSNKVDYFHLKADPDNLPYIAAQNTSRWHELNNDSRFFIKRTDTQPQAIIDSPRYFGEDLTDPDKLSIPLKYLDEFRLQENISNKPHWLKGYPEVPRELPGSPNSSDEILKSGFDRNFLTRPLTPFTKNELTSIPNKNLKYRKIGNKAGLQDLINKGGAQAPAPMRMKSGLTVDTPFFGMGKKPDENYKGLFAVELKPDNSNYTWSSRVAGTDNYGVAPFDKVTGRSIKNVPLEDLNVYRKKFLSNNYRKLDPDNLEEGLKYANAQQYAEAAYKWGARGLAADQLFNEGEYRKKLQDIISNNFIDYKQEGGEPKRKKTQFQPGTYDPNETAGYILDEQEVVVQGKLTNWGKAARDYKKRHPEEEFINKKKKQYLKNNKNLIIDKWGTKTGYGNKNAISSYNWPDYLVDNFKNEYDYNKNTAVVKKVSRQEGWNPNRRTQYVDKLNDTQRGIVAESKYGSKLQPTYWDRTLAGLATLASKFSPELRDAMNKGNMPGLTQKESQEILNAKMTKIPFTDIDLPFSIPIGGLESFAALEIPGTIPANYLKNTGLSTGSSYKEMPSWYSGEKMANVTDTDVTALNPLTYAGLEAIPELGINLAKGAYKAGSAGVDLAKTNPQAWFKTPEQILETPGLYSSAMGRTSWKDPVGKLNKFVDDAKIKSSYKRENALLDKYPGFENRNTRIPLQQEEQLKRLEIEKAIEARNLRRTKLPIKQVLTEQGTKLGGGQGRIFVNTLNPDEVVKIGTFPGSSEDLANLVQTGKDLEGMPLMENVAFPTKAFTLKIPKVKGNTVIRSNSEAVQFMPWKGNPLSAENPINKPLGFGVPSDKAKRELQYMVELLDENKVGIDYFGQNNMMYDPATDSYKLVDLNYVDNPKSQFDWNNLDKPVKQRLEDKFGYEIPKEVSKELPGSPKTFKSSLGSMDMSKYEIKNPDYFTQLLNTYDSRRLSNSNKQFYKDLIASVKRQNGIATERQYNELQRLKTGNFNFGKKGYSDGGIIMELSDAEIKEYKKGGWIIEEM